MNNDKFRLLKSKVEQAIKYQRRYKIIGTNVISKLFRHAKS